MRILRRKKDFTLSRANVKHRILLEQPDVYFYGGLKFRIDGKYKSCLALLRPSYLSLRDRKHLENIVATIRLDRDIKFHVSPPDINGNNSSSTSPENSQFVKFELHVGPGHGQTVDQEEPKVAKYEFKCKSVDNRALWKAYILAVAQGLRPNDCNVHLLPGQVIQIERLLEMERKRQSQRSLTSLPKPPSCDSNSPSSSASSKALVQHSKSLHPGALSKAPKHKFYKDGSKATPSYFFEHVSREMAEAILTMGHMYGNLLMRRSTSYPNSYALSFRSTINRNTEIFHYEVGPFRKHNSVDLYYEIKMEGKHPKFKCLNDVVKYFTKLTDGLAHCFTTNDLEKLGIKQPSYATHYEPPADYEEERHSSPVRVHLTPPPPPRIKSFPQLPSPPVSSKEDPSSEDITIVSESKTPEEIEDDRIQQFVEPICRVLRGVSPTSEPSPLPRPKIIPIEPTKSKSAPPDPVTVFQRKESVVAAKKEPLASVQWKTSQSEPRIFAAPQNSTHHVVSFAPPPPPPPLPSASGHSPPPRNIAIPLKPALKAQPDRKQFAPEKNLFRIALEYEEKPADAAGESEDAIQEPNDLANQLKGNVKSRVANLEPDPDRKAMPSFCRPPRKDFMGELAEKLKIRRQVVEQTCW